MIEYRKAHHNKEASAVTAGAFFTARIKLGEVKSSRYVRKSASQYTSMHVNQQARKPTE